MDGDLGGTSSLGARRGGGEDRRTDGAASGSGGGGGVAADPIGYIEIGSAGAVFRPIGHAFSQPGLHPCHGACGRRRHPRPREAPSLVEPD